LIGQLQQDVQEQIRQGEQEDFLQEELISLGSKRRSDVIQKSLQEVTKEGRAL
jgi:hypothetical protein